MKILFIRPAPPADTIGLQHVMITEPLELEILATLVKQENEVKIIDMILEKKPVSHFIEAYNPDVVCVTGYITHIPIMQEYCEAAKKFNSKIVTVVGGVHIEKFPEDVENEFIDYKVVRNATIVFPLLINFLKRKNNFPQGILKQGEKLDENKLPDFDFFTIHADRSLTQKYRHKYFYVFHNKVALVKASFGCPYECNFCYCRKITNGKYHARTVEDVIAELEGIKEKEIYFVDDDFLLSPERLKHFFKLLREKNIKKHYLVYGRADFIVAHPEIIKEFKELGLRTVIVGLESFKNDELNSFNKKTDRNLNRNSLSVLKKYKVECFAGIIVSPDWTKEDFRIAGEEMLNLGLTFVNLQPLTPLKGIGFEVDDNELVVERDDYPKWDLAHVVIRPKHMSVGEFYNEILKLYEKLILRPSKFISFIKYSPKMQLKMILGAMRVRRQYKERIVNESYKK